MIDVWCIRLDGAETPPPTPGEAARAARFRTPDLQRRYLRSHAALRAILARYTEARLDFAVTEHGKPFLPAAPDVKFNLSHSGEMALVAVAREVEIGVDIERFRPMPDYRDIAERFFPASQADAVTDEADFFRRWVRLEAVAKATGEGLYALGAELAGEWTIEELDAAPGYAAAVAARRAGLHATLYDFGANA
jgi:4'-phosphopantetheinyl transferase